MRFNLILGFFWLCLAGPLLLVNLTPVRLLDLPVSERALLVGAMAMVLAVYNFARWYASRMMHRRTKPTLPPKKRIVQGPSLEYNPEFDFTRPGPRTLPGEEEKPKG